MKRDASQKGSVSFVLLSSLTVFLQGGGLVHTQRRRYAGAVVTSQVMTSSDSVGRPTQEW